MSDTGFRDVVPPEVAAEYRAKGWWGDLTLGRRIEQLAAERPDDLALSCGGASMTWSDYDRQAWRVAHALSICGIVPGERVAIVIPDGCTVHAAFVGAERAGATVCGIGARAGEMEVEHVLRRTGASALMTCASIGGRDMAELHATLVGKGVALRKHIVLPDLAASPDAPIVVDGAAVAADAVASRALLAGSAIGPDDLFMINSTSGTTGLPKCVMHTQNRWMYFHQKAVEFGELDDEVVLAAIPAPYGFGLWTAHFTPALLGAPAIFMERFDADSALDLIESRRVTMFCCVSTQFLLMMSSPRFESTDFSSLRVMFTGGEPVPFEQASRWEDVTGSAVLQFFGSNETGLLTGTRTTDSQDHRLRTSGRVVEEMNVRLFDGGADVTDTGRGQPGCKGPATCLGYLDDPAANAELFTEDGWMLMADICEIDADGYLRIVGRKSDIIIRGGKNISAPEVERHVATHPHVALAAAVPMPDPVFGERVCLFVQLDEPSRTIGLDELNEHLLSIGVSKEWLPERLVVVDELPRSSGGKVAKGELRTRAKDLAGGTEVPT